MNRRSRLFTAFAIAGLLVCGGVWYFSEGTNTARRAALERREVAMWVLAEYISSLQPFDELLVVSNPFTETRGRNPDIYRFDEAGITGLKKGLGKGVTVRIGIPELRPEAVSDPGSVYVNPQSKTPLSFLVTERSFDRLARQHPKCEIVVSLVGLPIRFRQSEIWKSLGRPKLALLLPDWRVLGDLETVRTAFSTGRILAAVVERPFAPNEQSIPTTQDHRKLFDRYFLLVTARNVLDLSRKYPQLF